MPFGKGILGCIPSFTYQPVHVAENLVQEFTGKTVVDLGAGGRKIAPWVKTVDVIDFPGTDYVCDFVNGQTPFEAGSVDLVIATGVLEHVENDHAFMEEVARILKTGGTVHIELPFLQQYHDDPIDCRRLTLPGLVRYLEQLGFAVIDSGINIGPTVTMLTLTSYYIDLVLGGAGPVRKFIGNSAFALFSFLAWPLRYLDSWLIRKPNAHRLAFGVYATAQKLGRE